MKKSIYLFLPALLLTASCVDSLDDYNVNPKAAPIGSIPATSLVSNAERNLTRTVISANTNSGPFRYYVQYWAATDYPKESQYDINTRAINANYWNPLYRDVLADLKEAKGIITNNALLAAGVKDNQLACIEVLEVYTWSTLVNNFGDIPYSQALDISNVQPKYDDDKAIYADLITRLDGAISKMTTTSTGLGTSDLLNGGSMAQWIKFANSLKLRMALTIADDDATKAAKMAGETAGKVLASNADNIDLAFTTNPNSNPLWEDLVQSGRADFVGASTFIDALNERKDPRRDDYFKAVGGEFVGGVYGEGNAYDDFSAPGTKLESPTLPGVLLSYAQVELDLAEAVERGFAVGGGTAAEHYNKGVTASILEWGGTAGEATAYLAQPTVAYATAGATYQEKIGIQKWIALYNQPTDSYREWRRLDYPKLQKPSTADSDIPLRFPYPVVEQNLNKANYDAAAAAIGGDKVTTRVFWDKK